MSSNMNIQFEKASKNHEALIFNWLSEPHMMEFWDNSQEHKDDILNFIHGHQQHYFYGTTQYWISTIDEDPFGFVLSDILLPDQDLPALYKKYLSTKGHTIAIDFGIGNKARLGQGLASPTLAAFMQFYHDKIDQSADTFFIDPDQNNPRAKHVYEKAGFKEVGEYDPQAGAFIGQTSYLMVKQI